MRHRKGGKEKLSIPETSPFQLKNALKGQYISSLCRKNSGKGDGVVLFPECGDGEKNKKTPPAI